MATSHRDARGQTPSLFGRGDLGQSLLWIFPLFLIYGVGILFVPVMNGVDFVSRNLFALVGERRAYYLAVHAGLAVGWAAFLMWTTRRAPAEPGREPTGLWRGRRTTRRATRPASARERFLPMLLESSIYALTLGSFVLFVMRNLLGIGMLVPATHSAGAAQAALPVGSFLGRAVLSMGAGVYEELVFRLGLFSGTAVAVKLLFGSHRLAIGIALVVSSALFSAAHHVGALGDPFALDVFVYRTLSGILFASIYYFRSLAHATYSHALYDLYVLILR